MTEALSLRDALTAARRRLEAAGIEDASLEAEVLLRHALKSAPAGHEPVEGGEASQTPRIEAVTRARLFVRLDEPLDGTAAALFASYLTRRLGREPSAYITRRREFCSLEFRVTPATLIPRPETEALVETAVRHCAVLTSPLIADIGTGCGAIAVALAVALPSVRVIATDLSQEALDVAAANARRHAVANRIDLRRGDLLAPVDASVDLIAANLPYIPSPDCFGLEPEVRDFEPRGALDGGADGLDLIRRLLQEAPARLRPRGMLLLEFGAGQAQPVVELARRAFPAANRIEVVRDLAGRDRVLLVAL